MTQLNVGLVGCGLISEAHLRAWAKTDGFAVRGVLDVNREQAEKRAKEYGVDTVFGGLDELVAACDVVDVCTPPATHASIAEKAIAAGKHIVMEKPMVTDLADWTRMAGQISARGTKIAVIHNLKFLHAVRTAKAWVDQGRIGDVIRIQREFLTSAATDRMLVGDKHWSHKLPGGRWFETLPHELYLTHWFVGPLELAGVATLSTDHAPPGAPADEVVITLAGGRTMATIHFSANCEQNRRMFTIQGTEGNITVDLLSDFASITTTKDGKWKRAVGGTLIDAGQTLLRGAGDRARYGYQRMRGESPHARIITALARSLKGEGEEPTPLAEVDYVVRNCDIIGREIDRQVAARKKR
jgi:myo-inositol 2-dehydrogenase/D-chiro-inositol 1-dehydrogenase